MKPNKTTNLTVVLLLLCAALFTSCECTYQYNVNVKNNTGETINVAYKSTTDRRGPVDDVVSVKPGEFKQLIISKDLNTGDGCKAGTQAKHCGMVAEYVNAFMIDANNNKIPSKIKWCDPNIQFEKVDIQQAEFTINYTKDDF